MPRSVNHALRDLWLARMQRYSQSDLTVTEFCRREGVSTPSFYQWRKKLARVFERPQGNTSAFVPVRVTSSTPPPTPTLRLPGGAVVELAGLLGREQLTELLAACLELTKEDRSSKQVR